MKRVRNECELGFEEWWEGMKRHSCPNCSLYVHSSVAVSSPECIPVCCAECFAGYVRDVGERRRDGEEEVG